MGLYWSLWKTSELYIFLAEFGSFLGCLGRKEAVFLTGVKCLGKVWWPGLKNEGGREVIPAIDSGGGGVVNSLTRFGWVVSLC